MYQACNYIVIKAMHDEQYHPIISTQFKIHTSIELSCS